MLTATLDLDSCGIAEVRTMLLTSDVDEINLTLKLYTVWRADTYKIVIEYDDDEGYELDFDFINSNF